MQTFHLPALLMRKFPLGGQLCEERFAAVCPLDGTDSIQGARWMAWIMSNSLLSRTVCCFMTNKKHELGLGSKGLGLSPYWRDIKPMWSQRTGREHPHFPSWLNWYILRHLVQLWAWQPWGFPCLGEKWFSSWPNFLSWFLALSLDLAVEKTFLRNVHH